MTRLNQLCNGKEEKPALNTWQSPESFIDSPKLSQSAADISAWLVVRLAELLELNPDEIDTQQDLSDYG
ncbi:MAG: hypothetical protein ACRDEA_09420, partial [Microcystaceae cyanobacterium]